MIAWFPDQSAEVVKLARPLVSGTVASVWKPSLNVTVPVGACEPTLGATAALKVTA